MPQRANATWLLLLLLLLMAIVTLLNQSAHAGFLLQRLKFDKSMWIWAYDHNSNKAYFPAVDKIFRFDMDTDSIEEVFRFTDPENANARIPSLCVGGNPNELFILFSSRLGNSTANRILKLDLKYQSLAMVVDFGVLNFSESIDYFNNTIYIADAGSSRILTVPATGGPVTEIFAGMHATQIKLDSFGNIFFVESHRAGDYRNYLTLQLIPAGSYNPLLLADDLDGDPRIFVDKHHYPKSLYFTVHKAIKKMEITDCQALVFYQSEVATSGEYFKSQWIAFYPRMLADLYAEDFAVTADGTVYYTQMSEVMKLVPISDFGVFIIWCLFILAILIIATSPCCMIGCCMLAVDTVLVCRDKRKHKSSTNAYSGIDDSHQWGTLETTPATKSSNPLKSHPFAYVVVSAIRNLYYAVIALLLSFAAYSLLSFAYWGGIRDQTCTGSSCALGSFLYFLIACLGMMFGVGWCVFFSSPIYFLSSFLRQDPYLLDAIVATINLTLNIIVLVLIVIFGIAPMIFTLSLFVVSLPLIVWVPILIPAVILDIVFVVVLTKTRATTKRQVVAQQ